jgi:fibronectin-binding autotransporter adhesin
MIGRPASAPRPWRRQAMLSTRLQLPGATRVLSGLVAAAALATPSAALGTPVGKLSQLHRPNGCLVDRSKPIRGCETVRALRGPAPFLGSEAVAISPDDNYVYVAASRSNAIAIFKRNATTGRLAQRPGTGGCIAANGAHGCAEAVGLKGPNSVAVSADGKNVYATSVASDSVAIFSRDQSTGALTQAGDGSGCIANAAIAGCTTGRALDGADVVVASPDGDNVYVGAFFGNAVAVFDRDPSTGALTQPADDTGCLVNTATANCTTGIALAAPEGLAISPDGDNVYAATAASSALDVFTRNPSTGALTQAGDGTGCIANHTTTGCTTGIELQGANAVTVSPDDDDVYVTSLQSNSLTSFTRTPATGELAQMSGTSACVKYVVAVGCSLGRAMSAPEGLTVSPDGANVYAAAFQSGAVDVLNRNDSGAVIQKAGRRGCVAHGIPDCTRARALLGASSAAVSADGRFLYSGAFSSNAVGVFKRVTK